MDFFTAEVLTWRGPATYYILFVIQLETRRVTLAGMTRHPTEQWMQLMALAPLRSRSDARQMEDSVNRAQDDRVP